MTARADQENTATVRNGGPTMIEDCFLSQFMERGREMAHPKLIKAFLQPSQEAAMLFAPFGYTHQPPPVPPFLLAQKSTTSAKYANLQWSHWCD